jgi:hypothetical protein
MKGATTVCKMTLNITILSLEEKEVTRSFMALDAYTDGYCVDFHRNKVHNAKGCGIN